jgi:polyferredoxin
VPKKLTRRAPPDRSQFLRQAFQLGFLALNVWIGVQFYLFVRYYESGGTTAPISRPPGDEGWLPIASLMNLKALAFTGEFPRIHPAGTLLLIAFLATSWMFRKSFCSWLCPIGTISEYLAHFGRSIFRRNFHPPRWLDIGFRGVKYLLLALFVWIIAVMPVIAIRQFLDGPYGVIDDVRMLNFFREMELTGAIVMVFLIFGSMFVQNLWCRYLCPYGALMGIVSMASPLRIRRDSELCIDCAKCAKACPSALPVDQLITINSAECTGCLQCIASCPSAGALIFSPPRRKSVPYWAVALGIGALLLSSYLYGLVSGHWRTDVPDSLYFRLIPHADEFAH